MLRIVTDGAADLPDDWASRYDIQSIPLRVNFQGREYVAGVDLTREEFYNLVRELRTIPKTSLPSIGQLVAFYRSVAERGDDIISVHVGSRLSGTFEAIMAAARELSGEFNIFPIDSQAGSAAQALLCREARLLHARGQKAAEIASQLREMVSRIDILFTIENMEFARLSGRLNMIQAAITAMLKVNPIIGLKDGLLQVTAKVRTRKVAIQKLVEILMNRLDGAKIQAAVVVHAVDPASAAELARAIRERIPIGELFTCDLSLPVASHLGPGAVGVVVLKGGQAG